MPQGSHTYGIAIVHYRAHTRINDCLQVRARVRHPVARRGEIVVHRVARLRPVAFRADFALQRRVAEVRRQGRRVGVWVAGKHEVDIIRAGERAQDVVVAEGLRLGARRGRAGGVAGLDLVTAAAGAGPGAVCGGDGGLGDQRVISIDTLR